MQQYYTQHTLGGRETISDRPSAQKMRLADPVIDTLINKISKLHNSTSTGIRDNKNKFLERIKVNSK